MPQVYDSLVIGAGQAGLATAYHLKQAGLDFAVLEAEASAGGSWPRYYDSLELFSPARYSALPGLDFPGDPDRYPERDEVVDYLRRYAAEHALPVIAGARITRVTRPNGHFILEDAAGRSHAARTVVVATGAYSAPNLPELPGRELFHGRILHSSQYRSTEGFAGQRVLVVGAGNSAVQIAAELTGVARVTIASRAPVKLARQRPLGRDVHFWFRWLGIDSLPVGAWFDLKIPPLVLDQGRYRAALAQGRPDRQPMFSRFTEDGVAWADGRREPVDAVIFATGYRPRPAFLAPLGALADDGSPRQRGGVSKTTPGLFYVGLECQWSFASATLRGVGRDAARLLPRVLVQARDTREQPAMTSGIIACCKACC